MHLNFALSASAALVLALAGCDEPDDPATTGDEFEITIAAMASSSNRTDVTNSQWHATGFVTLKSDLRIPATGELDIGDGESYGYNVGVHAVTPDHVYMWDPTGGPLAMGMWMKMEPTGSHYLVVKLGSSAGTGKAPHMHTDATYATMPPANKLNADEKEEAEEAYGGWRFVPTYAVVDVTIARGTSATGSEENECTNYALPLVENREGFYYGANMGNTGAFGATAGIADGLYDITLRVFMPTLARTEDAENSWNAGSPTTPISITFTDVQITSGSTPDFNGFLSRSFADVAGTRYTVVQGLDGDPAADHDGIGGPDGAHTHNLYLKNTRSDSSSSPTVSDGTETLVVQFRPGKAQNVYSSAGAQYGPVAGDDLFFAVRLLDPRVAFDHHEPGFYRLPNAAVEATIVHAVTGAKLELHDDEFLPTYSHEHGFHYGAFFSPPWSSGAQAEGGGGHAH